jgi:3-dehydroquinate synthase/2-deoxy-scyllo-inosose synthase
MQAPTTFLAMHDSVTSLKQAVNAAHCKNQLGLFKRPETIVCDVTLLKTLDRRQFHAGLVELVKNALLLGDTYHGCLQQALKAYGAAPQRGELLSDLVGLGVSAKEPFVSHDPHERGEALIFEYGHTVGHAIEACSGGRLNHGESVAWGLKCAADVAEAMEYMSSEGRRRHDAITSLLGELCQPSCLLGRDEVLACISRDNKRGYIPCLNAQVPMVLLERPGVLCRGSTGVPLTEVPLEVVEDVISRLPFVVDAGSQSSVNSLNFESAALP